MDQKHGHGEKADNSRLTAAEMRFLRSTEGEIRTERIINEKIRENLKIMHLKINK
jgi:hypothetical protein